MYILALTAMGQPVLKKNGWKRNRCALHKRRISL